MSSISFRSEPRLACVISVQNHVHCSAMKEETTHPAADDDDISEEIIEEKQTQEKSQEE